MQCTLCASPAAPFMVVDSRHYFRCPQCRLTFENPQALLPPTEEKAQYDLHENHPDDPGYRRFLSQLADPLCAHIKGASQGRDFGCGPGPALAAMLNERGHTCTTYDPFYDNQPERLLQQYDFVTCTEALEHFHQPEKEWQHFARMVKPGGWLGIMTRLLTDDSAFANWHYRRDPTHVCFWQAHTFEWLAEQQGWQVMLIDNPVVLLQRNSET